MTAESTSPPLPKRPYLLAEVAKTLLYALAIVLAVRTFLWQPFNIPSASMVDTLLVGDYVWVSKYAYGYSYHSLPLSPPLFSGRIWGAQPQRGDIVVFKLPSDTRIDYIKRVIGLPGDRVEIREGEVFLNGEALHEDYVPDYYRDRQSSPELVVPPEHYYVLGDHRSSSNDSRSWGPVHRRHIYGKAVFVYWPLDKLGLIH